MKALSPAQLQSLLEEAAPELLLSFKPMFGGIMGYSAGKPFASLSNRGLALKLSGESRDALLAIPGAMPLQYEPDSPPSRSYVVLPTALIHSSEQLKEWILRSLTSLPNLRPRKRTGKSKSA